MHFWKPIGSYKKAYHSPQTGISLNTVKIRVCGEGPLSTSSLQVYASVFRKAMPGSNRLPFWDELFITTLGMLNLWCVHTNLLLFGRYWIYLSRLMSAANCKGVSDMSIIYKKTLMTEWSEGLFYVGCSLLNFMCAKMRI